MADKFKEGDYIRFIKGEQLLLGRVIGSYSSTSSLAVTNQKFYMIKWLRGSKNNISLPIIVDTYEIDANSEIDVHGHLFFGKPDDN